MIKIGNTLIANVKRGTAQIGKIYRGTQLIWENWLAYTGQLYVMTSTSAPSPFTCTDVRAFDNSTTEIEYANYMSDQYVYFNSRSPIKIRGGFLRAGNVANMYGVKTDDTTVLLASLNTGDMFNVQTSTFTYSGDDEFKAIKVTSSQRYGKLVNAQITSWLQKG